MTKQTQEQTSERTNRRYVITGGPGIGKDVTEDPKYKNRSLAR